jgi:hypothetical protein
LFLRVLPRQEFLAKEGVTGQLKNGLKPPGDSAEAWGGKLWDYLEKVADSHPDWGGKVRQKGRGAGETMKG